MRGQKRKTLLNTTCRVFSPHTHKKIIAFLSFLVCTVCTSLLNLYSKHQRVSCWCLLEIKIKCEINYIGLDETCHFIRKKGSNVKCRRSRLIMKGTRGSPPCRDHAIQQLRATTTALYPMCSGCDDRKQRVYFRNIVDYQNESMARWYTHL